MAAASDSRWKALFGASRIWGSEPQFEQLLVRIAADAIQFSGMQFSAVFLLERDGLTSRACMPVGSSPKAHAEEAAREAIRTARVISGHQLANAVTGGAGLTLFCAPLAAARGVVGALYLESSAPDFTLSDRDREFLETLALQAATAIEHANLYHSAITDPLTGLLTHRQFQQEVEHAVRRAMRTESPVSLLLLDLDHFKQLNDTCGHAAGNACLLQVSSLLKRLLRSTDVLARFGGDEFEVLLPDTPPDKATLVAEKIRAAISELKFDVKVTGTIGIAGHPLNAADGATLFLQTDAALYQAKEAGRNRVIVSNHRESALPAPVQLRQVDRKSARTSGAGDPAIRLADNLQEKIDGHVLVRRLGTGSNGEVLLVKQPELNREIALKRPLTSHLTEEQTKAFEQEARVTASLNHPGVVTVHNMGRDLDGRRYYTMKPLDGFSLAYVLDQHRAGNLEFTRDYSQNRLLEVLQRASETMAYAHQRGVAHLDLTPSNLVIGDFGEVTVIDWGCGASSSALTRGPNPNSLSLSMIAGSPRYLAPEQVPPNFAPPGPAADVFALGAMLYEILTLRAPFQGATLDETLRLLAAGTVVPPEQLKPEVGIDPTLSEICLNALKPDPAARITALEFSEKLGRFVRREAEWIVTRFGPEHPLVEEEWNPVVGRFELKDGFFTSISCGGYEHILLWKVPVQGSFRFVAEGWIDENMGELALIGAATLEPTFRLGYIFQFGAEFNTISKLSRTGSGVAAVRGPAVPGRKYKLELEYQEQEGWLHCYVDGQQIFAYRELFSFPGNYIGFYSFVGGTHIRPLEIHRKVWGLQVPAIRSADNLYRYGAYEAALERYREIAERAPNRLEGLEAQLKRAMSLGMLKRKDEARQAFQALAGTVMEPYALAEQSVIELRELKEPWRGLELARDVIHRFPDSQARWRLTPSVVLFINIDTFHGMPLTETLSLLQQLHTLTGKALWPPTSTQLHILNQLARIDGLLGDWSAALAEMQKLYAAIPERQNLLCRPHLMWAALANGRDDLLIYDDRELTGWNFMFADWASGLTLHVAVRTGNLQRFNAFCRDVKYDIMTPEKIPGYTDLILTHVAAGDLTGADKIMDMVLEHAKVGGSLRYMRDVAFALVETGHTELLQRWLNFWRTRPVAGQELMERVALSQIAHDFGDFERAASLLNVEHLEPRREIRMINPYLRQVMLVSLGLIKGALADEVRKDYVNRLAGPQLELAEMFFEKREPVPTAKWPHHMWCVEWRLWLAQWLEVKGRSREAVALAQTAIDARYGDTYSQPALRHFITQHGGAAQK